LEVIEISVLLPAKNECDNISVLLHEIDDTLKDHTHEIIVTDDASDDGTGARIMETARELACPVTVVTHQQSCGQSTAIYSAFLVSQGNYIVTLDADGQNNPADILLLLERSREMAGPHYLLIGHRQQRKDTGWRKFQSKIANTIRSSLLKDNTPDSGCGLKLLPRATFQQLPYFHHMHRFTPALVRRLGGSVQSVPVSHRPRLQGISKYTAWNRTWAGILDLLGMLWLIHRSFRPVIVNVQRSGCDNTQE
jgi:glycosyltransferase involved in cell wall biosynthesis